ncbi:MAG: DUF2851 family protein, partial [Bryobacteraceae bacterium]
MTANRSEFYSCCRAQNEARLLLRERDATHPPERLLQSVWLHQRLLRDRLQTLDGQSLRVLHPGFWNREAGPDFRGAVVQFGNGPAQSGDVEIDLVPGNWRAHGHDGNPAFAGMILRVVWNAGPSRAPEAGTLALEKFIDAPLPEIQGWGVSGAASEWPETMHGKCSAPLSELTDADASELLNQAARTRLERKGRELAARARQAGWEQALWDGLFGALGYKQNVWPMRRLAELLPQLSTPSDSPLAWQARLLGVAGLLPADIEGHPYLCGLWDHWWREREKFNELILPAGLWRFNGLRPANQPQRRLALAAHWLAAKDFIARLEQWFTSEKSDGPLPES